MIVFSMEQLAELNEQIKLEREACARIADAIADDLHHPMAKDVAWVIAARIRERGK